VSPELRFYFDYISPYAYLAWTQVHALAVRHAREVEAVPVLFAALLNHHGQKGPAEIPAKRAYIFKDVARTAHHLGVPLAPPASHPYNPLLALRVSSLAMPPRERKALIDALFAATWAKGVDVTNASRVESVLIDAGLDGPGLVALAGTPAAKDALRRQTEEAVQAGAFGVPTIVADGELFWGVDSLGHVERFLRGEDPVAGAAAAWANVKATAERVKR
jgi:2-hydroxychromene-2-carboxylate isomerase